MFRKWFASSSNRRKHRKRDARRDRRDDRLRDIGFELLEGRHLLATITWTGTTGNWDVGSNWSGGSVPTSTADVTISTASPATITIKAGDVESIHSLTLGANDTLLVTGGSLTTVAGLTNSGSITVSPGLTLTVGGAYSQSAGATLSMPGGVLGIDPASDSVSNSDFESPTANNTTTASSFGTWGTAYLSKQFAYTGSQSLGVSGSNSGVVESFSVTAGLSYTASAYAMMPASNPLTGTATGQLQLLFYNSSGVQISSYSPPNSIVVLSSASTTGGSLAGSIGNQGWNHFSTTAVAPAGATKANLQVTTQQGGGAGGGIVYWDDLKAGPSSGGFSRLLAASISNSGTITVGPTDTITTSGAFAQTSTGTLDVQIGGTPGSGNYGLVNVGGTATLAGTLKADIVLGYSPTTADSFIPVEFPSATGSFAAYSLPSGSGYQFQGAVTFTNVVVSAVPTTPVTTSLNVSAPLHAASTNLLGVNLTDWDPDLSTAQTAQLVSAAGTNIYRFPGGASADTYHFNTTSNPGTVDNFAQFVQFIAAANGSGMVTVNYGSGSPQEAAAELAYLEGSPTDTTSLGTGIEWNGTTNQWQNVNWQTVGYWASLRGASPLATDDGLNFLRIAHPAPITNVQYWEIGNEQYGSWEVDHHGTTGPGGVSTGAQHDPATYVAFAKQFATLATEILTKAGLPAISIGIDSGDPTGASDGFWTKNVLTDGAAIGFVPGFISDHIYMEQPGQESDSGLLNNTVSSAGNVLDWTTRYNDYEALLTAIVPAQAASVAVMATETNSVSYNPGKQTTSLVNGLFTAESIGSLLDSGYSAGLVWDLRNSWQTGDNNSNLLYGWREGGDYGLLGDPSVNNAPSSAAYIAYPDYFAMQLASKVIGAGGQVIPVSSNYSELDVFAVLQPSGSLSLLVINTNPTGSLTDQFNLTGYQPGASAQVWQYGETQDSAQRQSGTGAAALAQSSTTLNLSGASFSYAFPAYSMTVLQLQPGPPLVNLGGTGGNFAATFNPGAGAVPIVGASSLSLSDAGYSSLTGATVTIGNPLDGTAESLAVAGVGANNVVAGTNITATYAAGVLTLSGSDTLADYQQVLRTLVYNDTSPTPNLTNRTISVVITDAAQSSVPATSTVTFSPRADLQISMTDGQQATMPGGAITYTIVVTNAGPSSVSGAAVADALPAALTGATFTATPTGGASGFTASGGGNISDSVSMPSGSSITYVVSATISQSATGLLVNTATVAAPSGVTDPNLANNSATDTDSVGPQADLQITISDSQTSLVPGAAVSYTIVVSNVGPSSVTGATVSDLLPATFTGAIYTATPTDGATGYTASGSGNIGDTVNLPIGGTITYLLQATVSPNATGSISNTATVAVPAGTTDPNTNNNTATDTDTLSPQADLQITSTDGQTSAVPGAAITYTIVVSNAGPSSVTGATVSDLMPATFTGATYTATPTGGATGFTASGSGNIGDTVNLPVGGTITYVLQATVSPNATGSLSNTAAVAAPAGTTDPNTPNNSATDTETLSPQADLQITNTDGQGSAVPGATITYTIVVSNAGPSSVTGAMVSDLLPATFTGATYTATSTGGAMGYTVSGSGNIGDTVNLPVGSTITYTLTATISSSATGSLSNTATVGVPAGTTDLNTSNNTATDTETLAPQADLQITNTDGQPSAMPGAAVTYTIVVSNAGPSSVTGATVSDVLPATLTGATYTATSTSGATGYTPSGSGNIGDTVNLPAGSTITYVLQATLSLNATSPLSNTASVGAPAGTTDPNAANNTSTDTDALGVQADLQITNTDGQTSAVPGTAITYTIVVSNAGPGSVTGATVNDSLPATLIGATYTATPSGGATGYMASGSGNIGDTVNLPVGATITYVLQATVSPNATGSLSNTAAVTVPIGTTDPNTTNNTATDTDSLSPQADLQITNTDGQTGAVPGAAITYTLVVSNAGPSRVTGATVSDVLPATLMGATYTATSTSGATGYTPIGSGGIGDTVNLPFGATITYVLQATVSPNATGSLSNTATVAVPAGATDPNPANNSAADADTLSPQANLQITNTDGQTGAVPGAAITYTLVVSNAGPSSVTGATVSDVLPANLTGATFTATSTGGATGYTASGSGGIGDTVNLPAGSTITYTLKATISSSATGSLSNTATVGVPAGTTDPNTSNNTATDTDTLSPQANLQITNTDGQTSAVPGALVTYSIVVSNAGPSSVTGATVSDVLPAALTGATYTATSTGGATGYTASGSGGMGDTVILPVGSTITYTLKATISSSATGSLSNTATVGVPAGTTDPNTSNNTATDTDSLGVQADLRITDTDGQTSAVPGTLLTYTIVVSNAGPNPVTGAIVSASFPASSTWTATATGGASGFWGSAYGSVNNTLNMPVGSTITYVVHTLVSITATGTLTNTATVTAPSGIVDPNLANNTAVDSDPLTAPPANPQADLQITNTDGQTTTVPGAAVTFTIVATNVGPNYVTGAVITDTLPSTLGGATWTATATGDASGFWGSSSGNINNTVTMPPGSTITYVLHATVSASVAGTVTNTASVAAPSGTTDTNPANNSASDADTLVVGIASTTPTSGATGVHLTSAITVTFSAAMNASTINSSTFVLLNSAGQQVAGTVTYNASTKTATFTPSAPLSASSTYSVRLVGGSSGIKDQNGNTLTANFTWSFQTGTS